MSIVSSGALFDVLRLYRLLSEQQLSQLLALAHGRCAEVRALAKALIQRGWFTVYQMNQVLAGHASDLVLGPYQILDRLGKGGQSEVYKARHRQNNWTVALKVIRTEYLQSAETAAQFLQEVEAMADLDHPNIVGFWDADKEGELYYFAMEFVEGTDLGKVVQLSGALPAGAAAEYVRQTALGLQHAHEHNRVHRDIKPLNLFLTQPMSAPRALLERSPSKPAGPPVVKILDWGLASLRTSAGKAAAAAQAGTPRVVGTADYLSPEQALDPEGVDIRGDIYSLGCTLYFLLAGRVPFGGTTVMQKIIQHQQVEAEPVEVVNEQVPPALAAIVRRMMAKKPEDRFQTPAAAALALAPFCKTATAAPAPRRAAPSVLRYDETPLPSATLRHGHTPLQGL
jgi:serine/threonine protein kinase